MEDNFKYSEKDLVKMGAIKTNSLKEVAFASKVFIEMGKFTDQERTWWSGTGRWAECKVDIEDMETFTDREQVNRFFYIIKK